MIATESQLVCGVHDHTHVSLVVGRVGIKSCRETVVTSFEGQQETVGTSFEDRKETVVTSFAQVYHPDPNDTLCNKSTKYISTINMTWCSTLASLQPHTRFCASLVHRLDVSAHLRYEAKLRAV